MRLPQNKATSDGTSNPGLHRTRLHLMGGLHRTRLHLMGPRTQVSTERGYIWWDFKRRSPQKEATSDGTLNTGLHRKRLHLMGPQTQVSTERGYTTYPSLQGTRLYLQHNGDEWISNAPMKCTRAPPLMEVQQYCTWFHLQWNNSWFLFETATFGMSFNRGMWFIVLYDPEPQTLVSIPGFVS